MSTVKMVEIINSRWGEDDTFVGIAANLRAAKRLAVTYSNDHAGSSFVPATPIKWVSVKYQHGDRFWRSASRNYPRYLITTHKVHT